MKRPAILDQIADVVLAYHPTSNKLKRKKQKGETLNYEIAPDEKFPSEWRCEYVDSKTGDIYVAVFAGTDAEQRARKYVAWQQSLSRAT